MSSVKHCIWILCGHLCIFMVNIASHSPKHHDINKAEWHTDFVQPHSTLPAFQVGTDSSCLLTERKLLSTHTQVTFSFFLSCLDCFPSSFKEPNLVRAQIHVDSQPGEDLQWPGHCCPFCLVIPSSSTQISTTHDQVVRTCPLPHRLGPLVSHKLYIRFFFFNFADKLKSTAAVHGCDKSDMWQCRQLAAQWRL